MVASRAALAFHSSFLRPSTLSRWTSTIEVTIRKPIKRHSAQAIQCRCFSLCKVSEARCLPRWSTTTQQEQMLEGTRRECESFLETLEEPDDIFIRELEARKKFNLTLEDLNELGENFILKESPFHSREVPFRQYPLKEVVALALRKHGKQPLVDYFYNRYLMRQVQSEFGFSGKLFGRTPSDEELDSTEHPACVQSGDSLPSDRQKGRLRQKRYWYNAPSTSTPEGYQSIMQGLRTNSGICLVKGSVWFYTGSHVVFADWMHSIADVANYSYRLAELNRSSRHSDVAHPYGYAPLRYITADRSFVFLGFVGGVWPLMFGLQELLEVQFQSSVNLSEHILLPATIFVFCGMLEGAAVKAAYHEILSQAKREQISVGGRQESLLGNLKQVFRYLREGRDVMSTATFTEASSGVLGAGVGLVGLGLSWLLQSSMPDVAASIVMATLVCGVSRFLLRKSGTALLGQTLPRWRVKALVEKLEAHEAVVNVYDVKTEMVGTDTVRFKAEVQFNPQAITERILQHQRIAVLRAQQGSNSDDPVSMHIGKDAELAHAVLSARLQAILPQLQRGLPSLGTVTNGEDTTASWLYRNNGLFYEALAWELKDVERVLRAELGDFRNVHIDLEPW